MGMEHLVVAGVFLTLMMLIIMTVAARSQREKHRMELQKAVLERVGSVKDFAEFLTTEQGERFLGSLSPPDSAPHYRSLWSVRVGIVLLIVGLFLMVGLHSDLFTPGEQTSPPALLLGILLLIAAGAGMLVSAAVSFVIASRLGMVDRRNSGSRKDHPE